MRQLSFLLSSLVTISTKRTSSVLIPYVPIISQKIQNVIPLFLIKNSFIYTSIKNPVFNGLLILIFFFSLSFPPNFSFEFSSNVVKKVDNEILDQRQYGVSLYSLANFTLLFLLLGLFLQNKKKSHQSSATNTITAFDCYFLLFLGIACLSVIQSFNFQAGFTWLLKLVFGITIYFVFSRITIPDSFWKILFYSFLIMIFVEGFFAIFQFIQGGLLGAPIENTRNLLSNEGVFSIKGNRYFRVVGTLSHPSSLGAFMALLSPLALVFCFQKKQSSPKRLLAFFAVILCIIIQLLALSRWGLVTNIFAIGLTIFLSLRLHLFSFQDSPFRIKLIIGACLILLLPFFLSRIITVRFSEFSLDDTSLTTRLALIHQATSTIKENPILGVGGGNFVYYFLNNDYTKTKVTRYFPAPVHNTYYLFWAELGILGFILICTQIILIISLFYRMFQFIPPAQKLMASGLFCACLTFFFNGLWDARAFSDRVGFLYLFLLGLLVNILTKKAVK